MRPVSKILNETIEQKYQQGNFSLWFNKFIPLDENNNFRPKEKNKGGALEDIQKKYSSIADNSVNNQLLQRRHHNQIELLSALSDKYEALNFRARLKTRLITGLGQTHPTETGMVLDYNLGIPYIPAASVKGLVRFAHRLEMGLGLDDTKDSFPETLIPAIFGGQSKEGAGKDTYRGKVIFLDAYPESVPVLELDIMNPHYSPYYSDDSGNTPPGDWFDPVPVKFLTVAAETIYTFRALVPKDRQELTDAVKKAYETALTQEGVGAKTAVGYGRFEILTVTTIGITHQEMQNTGKDQSTETQFQYYSSPDGTQAYYLERIKIAEAESPKIEWLFQKWQLDENFKQEAVIAQAFLDKIKKDKAKGGPTAFYKYIAQILNLKLE